MVQNGSETYDDAMETESGMIVEKFTIGSADSWHYSYKDIANMTGRGFA